MFVMWPGSSVSREEADVLSGVGISGLDSEASESGGVDSIRYGEESGLRK